MKHGNKLLITDRETANAFITEYAKVSRLPKVKENDKKIKHEVNNFCRAGPTTTTTTTTTTYVNNFTWKICKEQKTISVFGKHLVLTKYKTK